MHLPDDRVDLQLNDWFNTDSLAENACTVVNYVTLATPTTVSINCTEGKPIATTYDRSGYC